MKYVSLFAGIGGFDLALNRLGHECVWANEWDKYAAEIYNKNFRELGEWTRSTECLRHNGDSTNSKGESWEGNKGIDTRDIRTVPTSEIPDHDLLVGGFPCQAFSIAGKRKGFDDTRGTLFFEIARILRDKRPRYFILENVKGLLSHDNGKTFATILGVLTDLGYDFQWQVLNSKNFGVPQNRERVFIVGHIRGEPRPQVFPIGQDGREANKTKELPEQISNTLRTNYSNGHSNETYVAEEIKVVGTLETDGWEKRHEQIRRVHGIDGISPTIPTGTGGGVMTKVAIPTNTKLGYDIAEEKKDGIRLEHPKSKTARGRVIKGASQSLKTSAQVGVIDKMRIRRLTPTECERLQGFPDGWTEGVSDTQRYKCLGNAVTVNVVYEVARRLNG